MSRLFPERVTLRLEGEAPLAAVAALQIEPRCKATVIVPDRFVRYALVPWSNELAGAGEEHAYIRHHFTKVHGERARSWDFRWDTQASAAALACAVDGELMDALKARFAESKARLASVQPELVARFNAWRKRIPPTGAWLVLAERDRACIGLHAGGEWRSIHNGRGAWRSLLERERYRLEAASQGPLPNRVLLSGAEMPCADERWQFEEAAA